MKRMRRIAACLLVVFASAGCEFGFNPLFEEVIDRLVPEVVYVDASADLGGDGLSWETAFRYLADAIAFVHEARYGDLAVPEIHVAEGVYYPDDAEDPESLLHPWSGEPLTAFLGDDLVRFYGGYPAGGGPRDPAAHVSVLSADIDQDDIVGSTGVTEDPGDIVGTNANAVIDVGDGVVLDGFTLTAAGGWSAASAGDNGRISEGLPTSVLLEDLVFQGNRCDCVVGFWARDGGTLVPVLRNAVFRNNEADEMVRIDAYTVDTAGACNPRLENVSFLDNTGRAIGIYAQDGGTCVVAMVGITVRHNSTDGGGGALYAFAADGVAPDGSIDLAIVNARFEGNQASSAGGGIYFRGTAAGGSSLSLVNCVFVGNTVSSGNGGACNVSGSVSLEVVNSTFSANHATGDGGAFWLSGANAAIDNTILWNDTAAGSGPEVRLTGTASAAYRASDVQASNGSGGLWEAAIGVDGGDDIDADPAFASIPSAGDGDWATTGDNDYGDLALLAGSPAGNAGLDALLPGDAQDLDGDGNTGETLPLDAAGSQRVVAPGVDMGAYESL